MHSWSRLVSWYNKKGKVKEQLMQAALSKLVEALMATLVVVY